MSFELLEAALKKGKSIIVPAILYSHEDSSVGTTFDFILDTGATSTHISRAVLYQMGYKNTMFAKDSKESFAVIGKYFATLCKVQKPIFAV